MSMHALERGMLNATVTLRPKGTTDVTGEPTWGTDVAVLAMLQGGRQRSATDRAEPLAVPLTIWVDSIDMPLQFPVGSLVVTADDLERVVNSITRWDHPADDPYGTGVHYYELHTS